MLSYCIIDFIMFFHSSPPFAPITIPSRSTRQIHIHLFGWRLNWNAMVSLPKRLYSTYIYLSLYNRLFTKAMSRVGICRIWFCPPSCSIFISNGDIYFHTPFSQNDAAVIWIRVALSFASHHKNVKKWKDFLRKRKDGSHHFKCAFIEIFAWKNKIFISLIQSSVCLLSNLVFIPIKMASFISSSNIE